MVEAPLVSLRDVVFAAHGRRPVDGIGLDIAAGRRVVVLGPNGAGKSLMMRLVHGLVRPTGGGVLWRGGALDRAARNRQAMVFQRPVVLRRSVAGNVRFALAARGICRRERARRAEAALAEARLLPLADQPARLLSAGEAQRLAVVRALACEPELLILDEPTANLDPASTQAIEALIALAHRRGVTILLVTHNVGQARRLADDIVFLEAGQIAEKGPAGALLDAPLSAPVQAWLAGRLYLSNPSQPS